MFFLSHESISWYYLSSWFWVYIASWFLLLSQLLLNFNRVLCFSCNMSEIANFLYMCKKFLVYFSHCAQCLTWYKICITIPFIWLIWFSLILRFICLKHLFSNSLIRFSSYLFSAHDSEPYDATGRASVLISLLFSHLCILVRQYGSNHKFKIYTWKSQRAKTKEFSMFCRFHQGLQVGWRPSRPSTKNRTYRNGIQYAHKRG